MPRDLNAGIDGSGLRVAVVAARFNNVITKNLMEGALSTLAQYGVRDDDIATAWVPGSFELPVVAKTLAASGTVRRRDLPGGGNPWGNQPLRHGMQSGRVGHRRGQ